MNIMNLVSEYGKNPNQETFNQIYDLYLADCARAEAAGRDQPLSFRIVFDPYDNEERSILPYTVEKRSPVGSWYRVVRATDVASAEKWIEGKLATEPKVIKTY